MHTFHLQCLPPCLSLYFVAAQAESGMASFNRRWALVGPSGDWTALARRTRLKPFLVLCCCAGWFASRITTCLRQLYNLHVCNSLGFCLQLAGFWIEPDDFDLI